MNTTNDLKLSDLKQKAETWTLDGIGGPLRIVRRIDLTPSMMEFQSKPMFLSMNMDRWLKNADVRAKLVDIYRRIGGQITKDVPVDEYYLRVYVAPRVLSAFDKQQLVALRMAA